MHRPRKHHPQPEKWGKLTLVCCTSRSLSPLACCVSSDQSAATTLVLQLLTQSMASLRLIAELPTRRTNA
jgi:hypothetical protein